MVTTKEEVDARRRKVIPMVLRGMTRLAIAKSFKVTERTVNSDIKAVKKKIAKSLAKVTKEERISEYEETARMRNVQLWRIILDKHSTQNMILKAVRILQTEDMIKIRRDQMVGLFPKDDFNLNVTQYNLNTADKIKIEFKRPGDKVIDVESEVEDE